MGDSVSCFGEISIYDINLPPESNCVVQSSIIFKSCRIVDLPLLVDIFFYCYGYPTFYGTEWPIMCWYAVNNLNTHSHRIDWAACKTIYVFKGFFSKSKNCDFLRFLSHCTHFLEHWFSWTLFQVGLCWIWVDTIWPNKHRLFDPLKQISSEY